MQSSKCNLKSEAHFRLDERETVGPSGNPNANTNEASSILASTSLACLGQAQLLKRRIWITAFLHLLFSSACFGSSAEVRHIISDDDKIISLLKQNIPKDYKMAVRFIPKEVSDMCWVELNVFHLEGSLKALAQKFGNVSSNKDHIKIIIQKLQDLRYKMGDYLEPLMQEFECHYREESWFVERYFDHVHDVLNSNTYMKEYEDCLSPSCPTTTTLTISTGSPSEAPKKMGCNVSVANCYSQPEAQYLMEVVGKSLPVLLLIPTAVVVFLIYWKIKGRKEEPPMRTAECDELFITIVEAPPPSLEQERLA